MVDKKLLTNYCLFLCVITLLSGQIKFRSIESLTLLHKCYGLIEHISVSFFTYFLFHCSKAKKRQSWPICRQSGIRPALVDWNYWDQDIFTTTTTTTTTESYDYYDYYYDAYD